MPALCTRSAPSAPLARLLTATVFYAACTLPAWADRHLLQVEKFDGPWRRQVNISGYLGDGFCTSNAKSGRAKSVMRTTVTIKQAGPYAVWVRAYTSENSRRALQVAVNGKRLAVTHKSRRRRWSWEKAGDVTLAAGTATITVHDADRGFESADAVLLTNKKDDDLMAEDRNWEVYSDGIPARASALRYNIDACIAACRTRTEPASKADWEARKPAVVAALRKALLPWPDKCPLNAQVTGRAERDAYTIENVVFESFPNFHVTANVYIPKGVKKPMPAVVVTAGHAMKDGKNYDLYRSGQLGLVHLGFLVIAVDPIGQGERCRRGYSHGIAWPAYMVGHSDLGYMTWEIIRAVDYLHTRPEVDTKRIGLTGNSGGGMHTFYTMPVEPRLAAGVSSCFTCSYYAWLKDGGNHCICNHLIGVAPAIEQFEITALSAPRPFLATNGAKDPIFPIRGTRNTIERARKIYAFYGAADHVGLVAPPLPHGWALPMREACYGWMRRWLQGKGDGSPIPEPTFKLDSKNSKDIKCFKNGRMPKGSKTFAALVREEAERLVAAYPPVPADKAKQAAWATSLRDQLWDTLGGKPARFKPKATALGTFTWRGHTVERLAIQTERKMEVPALLLKPKKAAATMPAVIALDDGGKIAARRSPIVRKLLGKGIAVLAMDPRAIGEITVPANHCTSDAVVLGRPLLAQQAWDVLAAARYLAGRTDVDGARVAAWGTGSVGLIATVAGALGDDLCAVASDGAIGSFVRACADPLPQPLWVYAPNLLKIADVSRLVAVQAPRPFLWVKPVGTTRKPLAAADLKKLAAPVRTAYSAAGAEQAFATCADAGAADRIVAFLVATLAK